MRPTGGTPKGCRQQDSGKRVPSHIRSHQPSPKSPIRPCRALRKLTNFICVRLHQYNTPALLPDTYGIVQAEALRLQP